jgi:hypothetical protein
MRCATRVLFIAALVLPCAAAAAVVVTFREPERYSETGVFRDDGPAAMEHIDLHLKRLGLRFLPAEQTLRIEVLDMDLAGEQQMGPRGQDIRVMRGRADWPRITLRYTWERPGAPPQSAEETVSDMAYLQRTVPNMEPFAHEKRMLETWFRQRFVAEGARKVPAAPK